ncbi:hypothetical protein RHMOL_Rhmol09G0204600 [Rhododendron molle]|uniref:Uncharacterized protein n=2 Tax=Rhododendron molle TaxID=49168 RepID=A0ACC0MFA7_RHOML|nr:hypothetical protein RHMOL_Rhmol09G0204600 [Rhododendron molle]
MACMSPTDTVTSYNTFGTSEYWDKLVFQCLGYGMKEIPLTVRLKSELVIAFEQKTGPYIVWVAFHGMLANIQSSTSTEARYFASLVPLANCLRLVTYGLSLATDEGLIKSVTREGKPAELLRGPLYYVLILVMCVLVFWRESPVGVISLAMMCGGDGVADIMGRKFGSVKIPYNKNKSWAGSISMFIFGFLISMGRHTHEEKEEIIRYNKVPQSEWAIPWSHHNLSTKEAAFFATGTFRPHPIHPFVDLSGRRHRVGKLEGKKVVYVRCGVNAVAAAQQMLDLFDVTGVVHFGIAGNTNDSMSIGDVSIPEKVAHTGIWNWLVRIFCSRAENVKFIGRTGFPRSV